MLIKEISNSFGASQYKNNPSLKLPPKEAFPFPVNNPIIEELYNGIYRGKKNIHQVNMSEGKAIIAQPNDTIFTGGLMGCYATFLNVKLKNAKNLAIMTHFPSGKYSIERKLCELERLVKQNEYLIDFTQKPTVCTAMPVEYPAFTKELSLGAADQIEAKLSTLFPKGIDNKKIPYKYDLNCLDTHYFIVNYPKNNDDLIRYSVIREVSTEQIHGDLGKFIL